MYYVSFPVILKLEAIQVHESKCCWHLLLVLYTCCYLLTLCGMLLSVAKVQADETPIEAE